MESKIYKIVDSVDTLHEAIERVRKAQTSRSDPEAKKARERLRCTDQVLTLAAFAYA